MAGERAKGMPSGMVLRLSGADFMHEWVLSMCLVLAVAAILSPLLLLFGLKFGTIETLRYRLIEDPRNREIRPMTSRSYSLEWLEKIAKRPDVAFIIPNTRTLSASVDAAKNGGNTVALDVVPTAPGDPLIAENGAPVPDEGQCVLSQLAAEAMGASPGDMITVTAKRLRRARYEKAKVKMSVVGVLDARATALKSVYMPLDMLEAVEKYKDGQAVPELGWPGEQPLAYPLFDGAIVAMPETLGKIEEFKLISGTGMSKIQRIGQTKLRETAGYALPPDLAVYLVSTRRSPVGLQSLEAIKHRLRGRSAVILPWVKPLDAQLVTKDGKEAGLLKIRSMGQAQGLDTNVQVQMDPPSPWQPVPDDKPVQRLLIAPADLPEVQGPYSLLLKNGKNELRFPVEMAATRAPAGAAFVPPRLAGILRLAASRNLTFDTKTGLFVLARRGYASFRLYAATIDDVAGLRQFFNKQGINVNTEAQRIRDVTQLDKYLSLIFWLIAVVGLIGGAAALTASLYASVERKQKELSVLRLLGLPMGALLRFPLYQGLFIAGGGLVIALGVFHGLALVINTLFKAHLASSESLCRLPWEHAAIASAGVFVLAVVASVAAALRTTRIDPAEALRDE